MATLPLQDIPESVREIDRAVALGAKGLNIGYNPCGHSLASEWFYPVWEKATQADLPIFIHPAAEGQDADDAEGAGSDDDKYDWHRGALLLGVEGFLHQETLAVASLMLGGVLDDFPSLKFCVPHGGGAVPYQFGRFEEAARREPVRAKRPLKEYLKNFYFDPIVHDVRARKLLVDFMGPDNVIVGSNFPGWDMNNGFNFIEELDLSRADKDKIMGGNAIKLFHL
jgi:aminocarboxymuconate-semialdehyde decarboxylase